MDIRLKYDELSSYRLKLSVLAANPFQMNSQGANKPNAAT